MPKRNLAILLLLVIAGLAAGGCAPHQKPLFNFEDYSDSYYAYKKNPGTESTLKLQKAIEEAIAKAGDSRAGKVPPGMYANLGYLYLNAGNSKDAIASFEKEKSVYPESTRFMDRLIAKVALAEEGKK